MRLFKKLIDQTECFWLEKRYDISEFCWMKSANLVQFTNERLMCTEKYVSVTKFLQYS